MTRNPEMCVAASLAQQARHGWDSQTPSGSVSLHMLFQSTIFRMIRDRKKVRSWGGKKEWQKVNECVTVHSWHERGVGG